MNDDEAFDDPPGEQAIEDLVRGLDNLHANLRIQADLLLLGTGAVPALVRFVNGPTTQFPDGRALAAEALGRIGGEAAFRGLVRALDPDRFDGLEPVKRLSEETVQNAVAGELARIGDRRAVPALIEALRTRRLLGAAEALAEFREQAALPWLIEGLEDAFKRDRLAHAILDMGPVAIPCLLATLEQHRRRGDEEPLPSLERRATALRLLGALGAKDAAGAIRTALDDPSDAVRMEAALALVSVEERGTVLEAVPALVAGLTHPDFLQRDRCAEALIRIGPRCVPLVEQGLTSGCVRVAAETVPLTANARVEALAVLDRLKERLPC